MFGSTSHFFNQSKQTMKAHWFDVCELLNIKGYNENQVSVYVAAFEYFCENPYMFDGATVVKDLCDLPGLDLDAMLHDYQYINYDVSVNPVMKWKADIIYSKGNERKGKSQYAAYSRFIGLTLIGIGFIPFSRLKRGKMTKEQKEEFIKEYNILNS